MNRRVALQGIVATVFSPLARATPTDGQKLAAAALAQVGVTLSYDPHWIQIAYPNGDVPRSTGVCADVVIRAARDALGLDLQRLLHEDMVLDFDAYPSRRVWKSQHPDTNIDHRRVLNLETYFQRCRACLWRASAPTAGDGFPNALLPGDIVTWLLDARLPHIGIVVSNCASSNDECRLVHNIGRGVEKIQLADFHGERAIGHYRWPVA